LRRLAGTAILVGLLALVGALQAAALTVTEFPTPTPGASHVTVAPDGTVWYAADFDSRLDPASGRTDVWAIPTAGEESDFVSSISRAPDGSLWIGKERTIARVDPDGRGADVGNMTSVLDQGLAATVTCRGACSGSVRAVLVRSGASRTASSARRRARGTVVARRRVRLARRGSHNICVSFSKRARRQVRRRGRLARLSVRVRVKDRGRVRSARRTVLLKRYRR
jgi:hypothetical protein